MPRNSMAEPFTVASNILGEDFISPDDVSRCDRRILYTGVNIQQLRHSLPSQTLLNWCHHHGYLLLPGPPKQMSLLELVHLWPEYCYFEGQRVVTDVRLGSDEISLTWLALSKVPLSASFDKVWDEQRSENTPTYTIPTLMEVAWALSVYKLVRRKYLLEVDYVRTRSGGDCGQGATIGHFDKLGFVIVCMPDDTHYARLGVLSKIPLKPFATHDRYCQGAYFDAPDWEKLRTPVVPPGWVVEKLKETGQPVEWSNGEDRSFDSTLPLGLRNWRMLYRTEFEGEEIVTRLMPGSANPVWDWFTR